MSEKTDVMIGKNTVKETLKNKRVNKLYMSKEGDNKELISLAKEQEVPVIFVDRFKLDKLAGNKNHQGVVALTSPIEYLNLEDLISKNEGVDNPIFLLLDEVQDVNNLGAIIRICDAFKINGIILNKRRSAPVNATVSKVSTGAINHVDICRVNNLSNAIANLKKSGYWIAALDMVGDYNAKDFDYNQPLVIVVGGEDKGITPNMKKQCDFSITIPMQGHVNSLNVSSAVSIICYEKLISSLKNGGE